MEIFSSAFFSALLAIILIDLALAGDNAIVIALAARRVPVHMQKKVLMWGSIAAVAVRAFCTLFVVWLLKVPGFLLAGGLVLIFISFKLVRFHQAMAKAFFVGFSAHFQSSLPQFIYPCVTTT